MAQDSLSNLRTSLDGSDGFVSGHRVMKTAGATRHAERMKKVPVWAFDNEQIKQLVRRCFPGPKQKKLAARLVSIIYRYYRKGDTAARIASDLNMTVEAVEQSLIRINRTVKRPVKRRGRPKNTVGIPGTIEDSGEDHTSL
jgi:hypothetical protein